MLHRYCFFFSFDVLNFEGFCAISRIFNPPPLALYSYTFSSQLNLMTGFKKHDLSENMTEEKTMFSMTRFSPFKILVTEKDSNSSVLCKLKSMKNLDKSRRKACLHETVWVSYYWYSLNILNTSYSLSFFPSIDPSELERIFFQNFHHLWHTS